MNIKSYEDFCSYQYVSRETYDKLKVFEKTLIKWQSSINLIGKSTIDHIWTRHFLDSAQLYPFIKDVKGDIIDFGSGAGFPGLVLAIMSNKNICLVDADKKKCSFLRGSPANFASLPAAVKEPMYPPSHKVTKSSTGTSSLG